MQPSIRCFIVSTTIFIIIVIPTMHATHHSLRLHSALLLFAIIWVPSMTILSIIAPSIIWVSTTFCIWVTPLSLIFCLTDNFFKTWLALHLCSSFSIWWSLIISLLPMVKFCVMMSIFLIWWRWRLSIAPVMIYTSITIRITSTATPSSASAPFIVTTMGIKRGTFTANAASAFFVAMVTIIRMWSWHSYSSTSLFLFSSSLNFTAAQRRTWRITKGITFITQATLTVTFARSLL